MSKINQLLRELNLLASAYAEVREEMAEARESVILGDWEAALAACQFVDEVIEAHEVGRVIRLLGDLLIEQFHLELELQVELVRRRIRRLDGRETGRALEVLDAAGVVGRPPEAEDEKLAQRKTRRALEAQARGAVERYIDGMVNKAAAEAQAKAEAEAKAKAEAEAKAALRRRAGGDPRNRPGTPEEVRMVRAYLKAKASRSPAAKAVRKAEAKAAKKAKAEKKAKYEALRAQRFAEARAWAGTKVRREAEARLRESRRNWRDKLRAKESAPSMGDSPVGPAPEWKISAGEDRKATLAEVWKTPGLSLVREDRRGVRRAKAALVAKAALARAMSDGEGEGDWSPRPEALDPHWGEMSGRKGGFKKGGKQKKKK